VAPPWTRDLARLLRDRTSPARRRARAAVGNSVELAAKVSPDGRVIGGPFEGTRLGIASAWGGLPARLAGTYECEISNVLLELLDRGPTRVLDLGAADGYYAVGIARRYPELEVVAFEIDPNARRLLRSAAERNHVPNLTVKGRVTSSVLRREARAGSLVLCDLEGYEADLLDPILVPDLMRAMMLVELHEFAVPGVGSLITDRFGESHGIRVISARDRTRQDYDHLLGRLSVADAVAAVDEGRPLPRMSWAVLVPTAIVDRPDGGSL